LTTRKFPQKEREDNIYIIWGVVITSGQERKKKGGAIQTAETGKGGGICFADCGKEGSILGALKGKEKGKERCLCNHQRVVWGRRNVATFHDDEKKDREVIMDFSNVPGSSRRIGGSVLIPSRPMGGK